MAQNTMSFAQLTKFNQPEPPSQHSIGVSSAALRGGTSQAVLSHLTNAAEAARYGWSPLGGFPNQAPNVQAAQFAAGWRNTT